MDKAGNNQTLFHSGYCKTTHCEPLLSPHVSGGLLPSSKSPWCTMAWLNSIWFRGCFLICNIRQTTWGYCAPFLSSSSSLILLLAVGFCLLVSTSMQFKSCACDSIGILWVALLAFSALKVWCRDPWAGFSQDGLRWNQMGFKQKSTVCPGLSQFWNSLRPERTLQVLCFLPQRLLSVGSWGGGWGCRGCQKGSVCQWHIPHLIKQGNRKFLYFAISL